MMKLGEIFGKLSTEFQRAIELNDALPLINRCYEEIAIFSRALTHNWVQENANPGTGWQVDLSNVGLYPIDVNFAVVELRNVVDNSLIKSYPLVYIKDYHFFNYLNFNYPVFSVRFNPLPIIVATKGYPSVNDPNARYFLNVEFVVKPVRDSLKDLSDTTMFNEHLDDVLYHFLVVNLADLLIAKEKDENQIQILKSIQNSHLIYLLNEEYLKQYIQAKFGTSK
jgi:hypothetical protein